MKLTLIWKDTEQDSSGWWRKRQENLEVHNVDVNNGILEITVDVGELNIVGGRPRVTRAIPLGNLHEFITSTTTTTRLQSGF